MTTTTMLATAERTRPAQTGPAQSRPVSQLLPLLLALVLLAAMAGVAVLISGPMR